MSITAIGPLVIVHYDHLLNVRWSGVEPAVLMVYRSVIVRDDHAIYRPAKELLESRPNSVETDDVIDDPAMMFGRGNLIRVRFS